jgi:predicted MPP superfamily phosphohydrolase
MDVPFLDLVRPAAVAVAERLPEPTLDVSRISVRVRDLPADLDGFTIAQVSDIHVGEDDGWGPEHLSEVVDVLHQEVPDIVVNTGDFVEREPPFDRVLQTATRLTLPGENRNFAVLGNHDYYLGPAEAQRLACELEGRGIRVLENHLTCLRTDAGGITLAGLTTEAPGWHEAVRELMETSRPRIVLLHIPDCAERLPAEVADLILSGHTHGGQVALPGLAGPTVRLLTGSRYVDGMYDVNGSPVYINRGLGCVGLPVRFRANPEVTLITLSR